MKTRKKKTTNVVILLPITENSVDKIDQAIDYINNQNYKNLSIVLSPYYKEENKTYNIFKKTAKFIFNHTNAQLCIIVSGEGFYSDDYIDRVVTQWKNAGKPVLFGNTQENIIAFTKEVLNVVWPEDVNTFTSTHLWKYIDIYYSTHIQNENEIMLLQNV